MRHRIVQATMVAVAVAVLLLGVPFAIFGARFVYDTEVKRIEQRAVTFAEDVAREVSRASYEEGELPEALLAEAVQPAETETPAHVTVSLPNGTLLSRGEAPTGPVIDAAWATKTRPFVGVSIEVSAWPAYIKSGQLVFLMLVGSAAAFTAGSVTAAWQAERLSRPFVYLSGAAEQLGAGQVRPRLEPSGVEEIDLVAAELARSSDRLAARLAVERQFTSDASHQLRTPLTALTMRLEEITLMSSEPEVQEEARISLEQVERLVGVVDDLLARSRKAQGGTTESVDLAVVFRQQHEEWRDTFESEGRTLVVEEPDGERVLATPGALAQTLSTLLENSLRHGDGTTTLRSRPSGTRGMVAVEVTDEGEGVPEDMVGQIFERGVTSGNGTGLGLALARDLVAADGGRLELSQRTPPVFSVFLAGVPRTYDPQAVLPVGSTVSSAEVGRRRRWGRG
ncbi:sensor histidine kinase [Myceligenerans salitolerans]|uniref:Signal transduction histidine-protein kinase/phosphatase MprB n=1 Tax=Myceligenerans salitolerans TaxID=1230528 RepID=A0ABS3I805_9MICO|nr:HAMP domain-containing sensor histidine kinase [Myceligenerans salitolerans]MBO0609145.1 sensor histidine kinase [Myceligenerans salitolerans]